MIQYSASLTEKQEFHEGLTVLNSTLVFCLVSLRGSGKMYTTANLQVYITGHAVIMTVLSKTTSTNTYGSLALLSATASPMALSTTTFNTLSSLKQTYSTLNTLWQLSLYGISWLYYQLVHSGKVSMITYYSIKHARLTLLLPVTWRIPISWGNQTQLHDYICNLEQEIILTVFFMRNCKHLTKMQIYKQLYWLTFK